MTVSRLRETRGAPPTETRASGVQTSWPMGYGWSDPAAIPPPGLQMMQRAGVIVTEQTMLQVDVVFTALRVITTSILTMGNLRAYTEELSADNIPYKQFKATQPPLLTDTWGGLFQYDGMRRSIMSMALLGEVFWYALDWDKLAKPTALEILHPAFMEVKRGPSSLEYWYGSGVNKIKLDNERVTHIPFMAMPQANRGMSPIEFAGVSGALAMAAYEFGSTWFSQGAAPSFILETDRKLGQPEVDRIASKFLVEHSGLHAAHLPLVLDNNLKAKKAMSSPDEAQYLQTLEYARSVIAAWFGLPPTMLPNALERQSPPPVHSMQEESQRLITYTLSGYMIPFMEAISNLLPGEEKAAYMEAELNKPDAQFLAQEIMALRNTQVASINDLRTRKLGWAPIDDPAADEALAPLASNTKGNGDQGEVTGALATPPESDAKPDPKPEN
jgi:HK97 family phage portal protein